jgi:hypothetical protein
MKRHTQAFARLLALSAASGEARAAILTTPTVNAGPYGTDVANITGNIVDLPLFDSNLGTLIGECSRLRNRDAEIGARMSVESAREHEAWHRGHCRGLRGTAAWNVAAAGMRGAPDLLSRIQLEG